MQAGKSPFSYQRNYYPLSRMEYYGKDHYNLRSREIESLKPYKPMNTRSGLAVSGEASK